MPSFLSRVIMHILNICGKSISIQNDTQCIIEILTRDSSNPGPTKPITSERTQLIQTHGTNDMTHRIKSNRTKRARACPNRQDTQACNQNTSHTYNREPHENNKNQNTYTVQHSTNTHTNSTFTTISNGNAVTSETHS